MFGFNVRITAGVGGGLPPAIPLRLPSRRGAFQPGRASPASKVDIIFDIRVRLSEVASGEPLWDDSPIRPKKSSPCASLKGTGRVVTFGFLRIVRTLHNRGPPPCKAVWAPINTPIKTLGCLLGGFGPFANFLPPRIRGGPHLLGTLLGGEFLYSGTSAFPAHRSGALTE